MVFAGGRPLWMLSLSHQERRRPVPVLRWSPTVHRRIEAARDRILSRIGTAETMMEAGIGEFPNGNARVTRQWRKPLSIVEINRMAPTPEVRARPGRP